MTRYILLTILIFLLSACTDNPKKGRTRQPRNLNGIPVIEYTVKKTFPHSTGSFTEGLLFHENKLFESTGSPENYPGTRSVIGIVDLKTGELEVMAELDRNKYFGEGILFFNDKLYQLTYKNQTGFIYDANNFKLTGTFTYPNKEGWGLTTDGNSIIMSDGTNFLTYLDPGSMKETRKLNITYNGSSALYANELEYINGFIYANIWTTNFIAKIDPADGRIVGLLDLTELYFKARKEFPQSEATNGIAYDPLKDRVLVTGKFWPTVFEISFDH